MARSEEGGVSQAAIIIVGSVIFILLVGTLIWFAIPGLSAKHHFVSPSGRVALDIGEQCGETACERRIIAETTAADGSKTRRGCNFELTPTHPVLLNAWPLWAPDEQAVEIVYADGDGQGGKLRLNIADDCTITE
jgi:hypothetical protein